MAKIEHYHTKFAEGCFYHVYNRTVDKQPLFRDDGNYGYFLKKYDEYISPVADTYAYCLLGNHFHLMVRIRRQLQDLTTFQKDLTTFRKLSNLKLSNLDKTPHDIVSHQFRKFFQSYAMAFNKQNNRVGTLFQTPFKRALVDSDLYFQQLISYIHANPQLHGLIDDFRDWKWSSYNRMMIGKPSKLMKNEVLQLFGGKEQYEHYHRLNNQQSLDDKILLDE